MIRNPGLTPPGSAVRRCRLPELSADAGWQYHLISRLVESPAGPDGLFRGPLPATARCAEQNHPEEAEYHTVDPKVAPSAVTNSSQ